jgi:hypothetical protein
MTGRACELLDISGSPLPGTLESHDLDRVCRVAESRAASYADGPRHASYSPGGCKNSRKVTVSNVPNASSAAAIFC